jgi:hypothetical protein
MFRLRPALASVAAAAIAAAVGVTVPVTPVAHAATRLFTGDYSTGDFSQWASVQNRGYTGDGAHYVPTYSATVVDDVVKGKAARFEVHTGDIPEGQPTGERSEVGEDNATTLTPINTTRWYAFSIKFDSAFPTNHHQVGWAITNQWNSGTVSAPGISFGFQGGAEAGPDGYWSLFQHPQSSPGMYLGDNRLLDIPLNRGNWIDVKMEVHWSPLDANGYVRVWVDGVRQTFLAGAGGGQTFTGRTTIPGDTHVHYHEGYYRESGVAPTGIIYHANFRIADSEDSL